MTTIGLILNPVAGLGGPAGLKGSDGAEIQRRAKKLGITSQVAARARLVLQRLLPARETLRLYTAPGEMGEDLARSVGFEPEVVGKITAGQTTAQDTMQIAAQMKQKQLDLILFAGGDGTARNLAQAVGIDQTVLGIPAGVKIHSGVYAKNPEAAAELAWQFVQGAASETAEAEVMDIDEEKFRQGSVDARLYGYLRVLQSRQFMQCCKSSGPSSQESLSEIANMVADMMEDAPEYDYVIGSGTTPRAIMQVLELPDTLLGVDVVRQGKVIASDVNEPELYALVCSHPAKIVITVIGGQGHILGRGNQQLSPRVLRAVGLENLIIIATPDKLSALPDRCLLVDSGDPELDRALCGYRQVITGDQQTTMMPVRC